MNYLIFIILFLALVISSLLAPIMARLFDKATYAFRKWLFKHFPASDIVKPTQKRPEQHYSSIYIPKPVKNTVNKIFRPLKRGNRVVKSSQSTRSGKNTDTYPLSEQPLNTINNPLLEFERNSLSKTFHANDSTTEKTRLTNDSHKVNK